MLNLDPQWRDILKKAWSVRFSFLAGVLSVCEGMLLIVSPEWIKEHIIFFIIATFTVTIASLFARVTAQKDLSK